MPLGLRDAKSEWLEGKELWGAHKTPEPHVGPGVRLKTGRLWRGESILAVQEDAMAAWASARAESQTHRTNPHIATCYFVTGCPEFAAVNPNDNKI